MNEEEFIENLKQSFPQQMTRLEMHMLYLKYKSNENEKNVGKRKTSNPNDSETSKRPSHSTSTSVSQASASQGSGSKGLDVHMKKLNDLRAIHQQKQKQPVSPDSSLIESQLDGERMVFQNVPNDGGGHCLFHSILHLMQRQGRLQGYTMKDMRRELAEWLLQLKDSEVSDITWEKFVFFVADNQYDIDNVDNIAFERWRRSGGFEKYVRNLRTTSQWGRDIEIIAAGLLYEVNIFVYVLNNLEAGPIKAIEVPNARTLSLLYRGGVHYEALIPYGT